jgi:hypothetical protein
MFGFFDRSCMLSDDKTMKFHITSVLHPVAAPHCGQGVQMNPLSPKCFLFIYLFLYR